jgi:predicted helicase
MREVVIESGFSHIFVTDKILDRRIFLSNRGAPYFFPLYLYPDEPKGQLIDEKESKTKRITNFTNEFLKAIKESIAQEPTSEEIFYYIYAVLYSPTYRKRYEEFLKIDFPRIPLPKDYDSFKEFSKIGEELIDLHLLRHKSLEKTEVGFPKSGSNKVEKVRYDEENKRVSINKEQYFDIVSKEVYDNKIGAYQVMEKYLKDRKDRKLTLDEINHYLKIAKAIKLTIDLQQKLDRIYVTNF